MAQISIDIRVDIHQKHAILYDWIILMYQYVLCIE